MEIDLYECDYLIGGLNYDEVKNQLIDFINQNDFKLTKEHKSKIFYKLGKWNLGQSEDLTDSTIKESSAFYERSIQYDDNSH